jgi:hypothetical protein
MTRAPMKSLTPFQILNLSFPTKSNNESGGSFFLGGGGGETISLPKTFASLALAL